MEGKRRATNNDRELSTIQPPAKRIRQAESSTSSMSTDRRRKPIADLVKKWRYFDTIDPKDTDDDYLADVLRGLFSSVCKDPMWKDVLDSKYEVERNCLVAIKANAKLAKECRKSMVSKDWGPVFALLEQESAQPSAVLRPAQSPVATENQKTAVEKSWTDTFTGDSPQALWNHVVHCCQHRKVGKYYGKFIPIVQSSGMGKSRLVDEFSKSHFLIPINLRPVTNGYPPADEPAKDYFSYSKISSSESRQRSLYFLTALFLEAAAIVGGFNVRPQERASTFRKYLAVGMTFDSHGPNRVKYYQDVKARANELNPDYPFERSENDRRSAPKNSDSDQLIKAIVTLLGEITKPYPTPSKTRAESTRIQIQEMAKMEPKIFVAFDEAHFLSEPLQDSEAKVTNTSHMAELRRNLETIGQTPVFTLFLSTTGKISSLVSSYAPDISARLINGTLLLMPAFSDLGYDQLMLEHKIGQRTHTLEQVTGTEFMAKFGRPMWGLRLKHHPAKDAIDLRDFALMKLLGGDSQNLSQPQRLACLSQRLALELNSKTYIAVEQERKQVEGHMRLCLRVENGSETMTTVSPSEPILAEAASSAMQRFDNALAMEEILGGFSIHQGDRGELLVMLLLTMARDAVIHAPGNMMYVNPVVPTLKLVEKLFTAHTRIKAMAPTFSPDRKSAQPFGRMLANSATHFNHFIKFQQQSFWTDKHLAGLLARGAFILCATGQSGVDLVGVALRDKAKPISSDNIIIFLWQVKNDPRYTDKPDDALFDAMDPILLKIVDEDAKDVVVVRVVTALAATTSSTKVILPRNDKSKFTAYDIWCAGMSPDVYVPIGTNRADTWAALLNASRGWEKMYGVEEPAAKLRRQENVGASVHLDHWNQWWHM